jgi:hypothetical protein
MATVLAYRHTDISGNLMNDDSGPRWPILPSGHARVHCQFCLHASDAPSLAGAESLNLQHAEARHGWQQQKGA